MYKYVDTDGYIYIYTFLAIFIYLYTYATLGYTNIDVENPWFP